VDEISISELDSSVPLFVFSCVPHVVLYPAWVVGEIETYASTGLCAQVLLKSACSGVCTTCLRQLLPCCCSARPSTCGKERRKEGRGAEREQETRTYPLCLQVCAAETVHVLHRWSGAVVIVEKGAVQGLRYHVYPALTSLKFIIWNLLN